MLAASSAHVASGAVLLAAYSIGLGLPFKRGANNVTLTVTLIDRPATAI